MGFLYVRLDLSRRHEGRDLGKLIAIGLNRVAQRPDAQLLCLLLRRVGQCRDERSTPLQKLPGTLASLPVDQVEDHIQIGRMIFEALNLVVDDNISTKRLRKLDVGSCDRGKHAGALRLRELDGEVAYSTRATMDEHRLAGFQSTMPKQSLPRRLPSQRNCGRMHVVQAGGFAGDRPLVERDFFAISAAPNADDSKPFVADLVLSGLGAALLDNSGDVPPQRVRQTVLFNSRVLAVSNFEVDRVDARCLHAY